MRCTKCNQPLELSLEFTDPRTTEFAGFETPAIDIHAEAYCLTVGCKNTKRHVPEGLGDQFQLVEFIKAHWGVA